jgi:hypothetical protein
MAKAFALLLEELIVFAAAVPGGSLLVLFLFLLL